MKELLVKIGELIDSKNTTRFTVIGFGYIDVIVELAFDDCYEYFISSYDADGTYSDLKRCGYSEDHKDLGTAEEWKAIYKRIDEAQEKAE